MKVIIYRIITISEKMQENETVCKCCSKKWVVTSYNFHDLCTPCFNNFDNTKMKNRFGGPSSGYDAKLESSDYWVKSGLCDHTHQPNMMMQFYESVQSMITETQK